MTACGLKSSGIKTEVVEVPTPKAERLDDKLLERRAMPAFPSPDAIDPRTLRPTIKQSTWEQFLSALLLWSYQVDGQLRDIILAQPEKN